jgi:hypothetical protein
LGGDRSKNTLATSVFLTAKDGIQKGLTYRVRYRAVNEIGEGPWSDIAYVQAATLPMAPPSPVASSFDSSKIDLVLSRTSDNGGSAGGEFFKYKLQANLGYDGSPFALISNYDGQSLSYTVNIGDDIGDSGFVFELGKVYTFKLTAENEVGDSELRYLAPTLRIAFGGLPPTPVQPVVDESGSSETSIRLVWPVPASTDDLPITRYILWSDLAIPGNQHAILNSTDLNVLYFVHHGLTPGALYSYWL